MHRLLQGLEEMFRLRAESKGLQLIVDLSPGIPQHVFGDEGKLRQVLINLLGNAFKFTDTGGVALRVRWRDNVCAFEVEDTGHGITDKELASLFEAFVQTQSGVKSKEGTGLGLAISRNFVRLMGGDISVKSEPEHGTTFHFEIRLQLATAADMQQERGKVIGIAPGQPPFRILVADDKWENRALLVKLLASVGFQVREAANGREAIGLWADWHPHLIWMDMRMPVMDGFVATKRIRDYENGTSAGSGPLTMAAPDPDAAPADCHVFVIAVTASAFEQDRNAIYACGCDDFVAKPYRESTIFEKMAEHLGIIYVYDEPAGEPDAAPVASSVTPARLAALPAACVARLSKAVMLGDVESAYEVVEEIRAADEMLAGDLRSMIRGYRFDEILDVVEQV
jgi:two-component system sensor histidine kinase/response regulator